MEYFTVLTNLGAAKIAQATANKSTVDITHIAIGDGNGNVPTPNIEQTSLVNEVHKRAVNELSVDEKNDNYIVIRSIIPIDVGNFWIREVGIYDADGDLIAVGNYPETYKSLLQEGVPKEVDLKVIFEVSNAKVVNISINPSVVMASQEFVNNNIKNVTNKIDTQPSTMASYTASIGNVSLSNTVNTLVHTNVTYDGNGVDGRSIVTNIGSVDFTGASNGSGHWLDWSVDRLDFDVKTDAGIVVPTGMIACGTSHVIIKCTTTTKNWAWCDGLRGSINTIWSNLPNAEDERPTSVKSFSNVGIVLGDGTATNEAGESYFLEQHLFTHIKWGLTNQGKKYVMAFNALSGRSITVYQGSGVAGHEVDVIDGSKLCHVKCLTNTVLSNWTSVIDSEEDYASLTTSEAFSRTDVGGFTFNDDKIVHMGDDIRSNANSRTYIAYGYADSLTQQISTYIGEGVSGGASTSFSVKDINGEDRLPLNTMVKAINDIRSWFLLSRDKKILKYNLADEQSSWNGYDFTKGNITYSIQSGDLNKEGISYLSLTNFDTKEDGSGSYVDLPSDITKLHFDNTIFQYTDGLGEGGYNRKTTQFTGDFDDSLLTGLDGKYWVAREITTDNWKVYDSRPSLGLQTDEDVLYFDMKSGNFKENKASINALSFYKHPVIVASGEIQGIDYTESLEDTVIDTLKAQGLVQLDGNTKRVWFGRVYKNNRYVRENPFGNENWDKCTATAFVEVNGQWGETGWFYSSGGYGIKANSMDDGIAIQSGTRFITNGINDESGSGFKKPTTLTEADCYVDVFYKGEVKDA